MLKEIRKIIYLLHRHEKIGLIWLFLLMVIGAVLEIAGISAIPVFINVITNPEVIKNYPVIDNWLTANEWTSLKDLLIVMSLGLVCVFIVKNAFMSYLLAFKSTITTNIQLNISYTLLSKYFAAPYTFHLQRNSIDLFSKVFDESRIIITGVMVPFLTLLMDLTFCLAIILLLFVWDPFVSGVTFLTLGLTGYGFLFFTRKKSRQFGKQMPDLRLYLNRSITEGLNGLKDARVLNREYFFLKRSKGLMKKTFDANKYLMLVGQLTKPFIETMAIFVMVFICIFQVAIGRSVESILPLLTLFAVASIRLLPTANQLVAGYTGIRNTLFTVDPVFRDFKSLEQYTGALYEKEAAANSKEITQVNTQIAVQDLCYTYPGASKSSLENVSFSIRKGDAIGLVGSSGAGKTTLVDILLGLLVPQSGSVKVDGQNIFEHIRPWQRNIGYIPQQIYLSDNTIKRNIAFGIRDEEIDDDKLWTAIRAAQLEEVINGLPEGIHTEIGERGVRLSGGQRQRIGIARALYHNPQVLIMDEATSALDNITEKYVVEAIERLKGDRTIITIAHRLSTVKNCDRLYLMKGGRIISQGTYDELLENSAEFREMAK